MATFSAKAVTFSHAVTFAQAVSAIGCTIIIWLMSLAGFFLWAQDKIQVDFPLEETPLAIQIPKNMPVTSTVNNQLVAHLNHTLSVAVPINETITARLPKHIPIDINLHTLVQINTEIYLKTIVGIDATFELNAPIDNPLAPFRLPIKLPLKFDVPVNLTLPINEAIPLQLNTPAIAKINDPIPALFQTTLHSQVPIDTTLNAQVISKAKAHLMLPTAPIQLELMDANLRIAIDDISLVRSSLNYPAKGKSITVDPKDLIYIYDAKKKPP